DVLRLADSLLLMLVLTDNESLIDVLVLVESLLLTLVLPLKLAESLALRDVETLVLNDNESLIDVLKLVDSLTLVEVDSLT
ncbi:hypothetical protein MXM43_16370, partial [Enterococcus innesii]